MIGISQISLEELNFFSAMKLLKANKFEKIGIFFNSIKGIDLLEVKQCLKENRITPINLSAAGINTPSYTAWVEDVLSGINTAHYLGIKDLIVIASPMGCNNVDTSILHLKKGMKEVMPVAKAKGVRLLFEPLHPILLPYSIFTTYKDALEFVNDYNRENVGLVLDLFHTWWDKELDSLISKSLPYLGCVQLSNWGRPNVNPLERSLMGDGLIPVSKYLNILVSSGYKGIFEIEIISDSWKDNREEMLKLISDELENLEEFIYST